MQTDADTPHALRDGDLCSEHLGMTWSVQALLRSWALDELDLRQALRLTAQVATTAGRSEGGLMSVALSPHERSLRVTVDEHGPEASEVSVEVSEQPQGRATFVVARQRSSDEPSTPEDVPVVWFSLTMDAARVGVGATA